MNAFSYFSRVSGQAISVDHIFFALTALSAVIAGMVFLLIAVFSVRYRAGSVAPRGRLPKELEIGWTVATFFLFLFIFWWAAANQLGALEHPRQNLDIHVVAKQWIWKTQQPNGIREINEIHAPVDTPVRLVLTSQDVIHSMFLPALRIKQDVLPGRTTYLWFTARKPGIYHLLCAEFCGTEHSRMTGRLVLMSKSDFARWSASQQPSETMAAQGEKLFRSLGCSGCHGANSTVHAPDLSGVYGRAVHLSDGRVVTADEAYLRDSILLPGRDVVAGYKPEMPSFAGIVKEDELVRLLAYLKSLQDKPVINQRGEIK